MKDIKTKSYASKRINKKTAIDKKLIDNFSKVYATILNNICCEWIHDEDNGNDYGNVGCRHVDEIQDFKVIYQPKKKNRDNFVEEGQILVVFPKNLIKIEKDEIKKIKEKLDNMLLSDYHSMKKECNGIWFKTYKNETLNEILDITSPFQEVKKNMWKLSYRPLNDIHGNGSYGWVPKQIQEFIGEFNEDWYQEIVEKISES